MWLKDGSWTIVGVCSGSDVVRIELFEAIELELARLWTLSGAVRPPQDPFEAIDLNPEAVWGDATGSRWFPRVLSPLGARAVPCADRFFPPGAVCSRDRPFVPIEDSACDRYGAP